MPRHCGCCSSMRCVNSTACYNRMHIYFDIAKKQMQQKLTY
jgi:hypothetical protein